MPNYYKAGAVDLLAESGGGGGGPVAPLGRVEYRAASLNSLNTPAGGSATIHTSLVLNFTPTKANIRIAIELVGQSNGSDEAKVLVLDANNSNATVPGSVATYAHGTGFKRVRVERPLTVTPGVPLSWRLGHAGTGSFSSVALVSPDAPITFEVWEES